MEKKVSNGLELIGIGKDFQHKIAQELRPQSNKLDLTELKSNRHHHPDKEASTKWKNIFTNYTLNRVNI